MVTILPAISASFTLQSVNYSNLTLQTDCMIFAGTKTFTASPAVIRQNLVFNGFRFCMWIASNANKASKD
jgi:hypothetical protein